MCKKKKISLSTNRKYHYRKHKTKTKPSLQDHRVNNSVREETSTFSVYGHSDLHSVTQRNERHSYFQICHDHSYSMPIPKPEAEYDWDHMQTTDLSNESPSFSISQESQDNCYSMNVQVSELTYNLWKWPSAEHRLVKRNSFFIHYQRPRCSMQVQVPEVEFERD